MLSLPMFSRRHDAVHRAMESNPLGQVWLNVASASEVLVGYVNLDNSLYYRLDPLIPVLQHFFNAERVRVLEHYREASRRAPVLMHDCRRRLPFPDESVDHVLCSHFIEHVYPDEAVEILADFRRVLRPEGTLHIIVPNLGHMVRKYVEGSGGADSLLESTSLSSPRRPTLTFRALEFLGYEGLKHRWMYDQSTIARRVIGAGFDLVDLSLVPSRAIRSDDAEMSIHVPATKRSGH